MSFDLLPHLLLFVLTLFCFSFVPIVLIVLFLHPKHDIDGPIGPNGWMFEPKGCVLCLRTERTEAEEEEESNKEEESRFVLFCSVEEVLEQEVEEERRWRTKSNLTDQSINEVNECIKNGKKNGRIERVLSRSEIRTEHPSHVRFDELNKDGRRKCIEMIIGSEKCSRTRTRTMDRLKVNNNDWTPTFVENNHRKLSQNVFCTKINLIRTRKFFIFVPILFFPTNRFILAHFWQKI